MMLNLNAERRARDSLALTSTRSSFVSASPEIGSVPFSSDRLARVNPKLS